MSMLLLQGQEEVSRILSNVYHNLIHFFRFHMEQVENGQEAFVKGDLKTNTRKMSLKNLN